MLIPCIIAVAVLLLAYAFHTFYLKPQRACQRYANLLTQLGYKVYQLPFRPFSATLYELYSQNGQLKGDACYANKHIYRDYDVIISNIVFYPSLVFANINLGKEILAHDKVFTAPKISLSMKLLKHTIGEGLAFIEGEAWKERRKILSKAFSFDFIKQQIPLISKIFDQQYDRLLSKSGSSDSNQKISAELFLIGNKIFALVVLTGFLGFDNATEFLGDQQIQECAMHIVEEAATLSRDPLILMLGVWFYKLGLKESYRRLQSRLQLFRGFIDRKVISFRDQFNSMSQEQQSQCQNLVQLMLYHSKQEGKEMKNEEIIDQILTFVVAGADSTAVFTVIICYIFENQKVEQNLRQLIGAHFLNSEDFNYENLRKLEYLDWVMLQAMRMNGPVDAVLDRISATDFKIGDIPIQSGTALSFTLKSKYTNNDVFDKADQFLPERWANPHPEQLSLVSMHFSGGPRSCIGKNLALVQLKIAVIKFLQRFIDLKETNERQFVFTIMYHLKSSAVTFRPAK